MDHGHLPDEAIEVSTHCPIFVENHTWDAAHDDLMTDETVEQLTNCHEGTVDLDTYLSTTGRSGPELALAAEEPPAEEEEDRFDPADINLHYEESPEDVFKPITNK